MALAALALVVQEVLAPVARVRGALALALASRTGESPPQLVAAPRHRHKPPATAHHQVRRSQQPQDDVDRAQWAGATPSVSAAMGTLGAQSDSSSGCSCWGAYRSSWVIKAVLRLTDLASRLRSGARLRHSKTMDTAGCFDRFQGSTQARTHTIAPAANSEFVDEPDDALRITSRPRSRADDRHKRRLHLGQGAWLTQSKRLP